MGSRGTKGAKEKCNRLSKAIYVRGGSPGIYPPVYAQSVKWGMPFVNAEKFGHTIWSELSWGRVFAFAGLGTLFLFLALNWSGCWLFRYGLHNLVKFLYPFVWLVLFFALRARWRISLFLVTISALILFGNGRWGIVEVNAAAESSALQAIKQMHSSLAAYRAANPQQSYPESLPSIEISSYARKFYVFAYVPRRSASGEVIGYEIEATPARRDCDYHRSFTITEAGRIFWTLEPRAATTADNLYRWD